MFLIYFCSLCIQMTVADFKNCDGNLILEQPLKVRKYASPPHYYLE